ncbi:MAG: hypothetical protein OXG11_09185, partial [Chloroflexi bacterium]|nr:hypothetical protein [Chloroflexota bacterium]
PSRHAHDNVIRARERAASLERAGRARRPKDGKFDRFRHGSPRLGIPAIAMGLPTQVPISFPDSTSPRKRRSFQGIELRSSNAGFTETPPVLGLTDQISRAC